MWGAEKITVRFGRHESAALAAVSAAIPVGEVTALVGGDGAGKSTLLRALLGRVPVSGGRITMPAPEHIGYQPSSSGVWRTLSVDENLDFVGSAYGMAPRLLQERKAELLSRAGLVEARDRLGGQLSGGMRQKLGFCLAMLPQPQVLLLDEPSTGVDPVSRVELWRLIAESATGGTAVCLTTTYLDEAERAATVIALDAGHTLAAGTPDEILAGVPGNVTVSTARPAGAAGARTWRRGTAFHTWTPPGAQTSPGEPSALDLEDAIIALTLAREAASGSSVPGGGKASGRDAREGSAGQAAPEGQDAASGQNAATGRETS